MDMSELATRFDEYHNSVRAGAAETARVAEQLDALETLVRRPGFAAGAGDARGNLTAERKALGTFARSGEIGELKNLSLGSDPDGGYLESPALSDQIRTKLFDASPIRGLANVVVMGAGSSWQEPVDTSDADASWVGETETRSETSAGSFGLVDIPLDECTALVKLTQRLIDDSRFDIGQYVVNKLIGRFARLENTGFVSGNGVKKPKGFLSYATASDGDATRAAQTYQWTVSGGATTLVADGIINTFYSLRAPYRANATWVMSSDTARQVRLLKDGNGAFIWAPSLAANTPDLLCGKPVAYDENMPQVAAGSYPIAIADWKRAYTVIERPGMKWLYDPFSARPYVQVYATRRVGGQSSGDFDAMKLTKVSA